MSIARGDRITRMIEARFSSALDVLAPSKDGNLINAKLVFAEHIDRPRFCVSVYAPEIRRFLPIGCPQYSKKQDALDWFARSGETILETLKSQNFLNSQKVSMPAQRILI